MGRGCKSCCIVWETFRDETGALRCVRTCAHCGRNHGFSWPASPGEREREQQSKAAHRENCARFMAKDDSGWKEIVRLEDDDGFVMRMLIPD